MTEEEDKKTIAHYFGYNSFEEFKVRELSKDTKGTIGKAILGIVDKLEQNEKVIEEMAKYIEDSVDVDDDICNKQNCFANNYVGGHCGKCVNCIINYFRKR